MSSPEPVGPRERALIWFLRIGGVMTGLAIPLALLSDGQIAAIHAWLGLGDYPQRPITAYLARSLCLFYGMHGILLLVISTDVRRYRTLVLTMAWMALGMGPALFAIDRHAGLPFYWVAFEGPLVTVLALGMLWLSRSIPR